MDALTIIFRAATIISFGSGLYFATKKKFWFPAIPMIILAIVFAETAEKEWQRLLTHVIPLLGLYIIWTGVRIYLKKLKNPPK